ncbi:MAG: hypothetical protein ACI9OH_002758 [Oleispira sp.]|jgi:hypothetical protein
MIIENIKTLYARIKVSEIKVIALILIIASISGCSKAPIPATFIEYDSFTNSDWYMVHYELKTEQWNDPEVLSTPRVQFVWAAPDTPEEDKAIWSMRTDGTDLRQVVSPKLFDTPVEGGPNSGWKFQRSPGNRYIAAAIMTKSYSIQLRIIDLETRDVTVIPTPGYGDPHFAWLNDHILLLRSKSPLMQYDILKKELVDLEGAFPDVNIRKYHVYDQGNKIILRDYQGVGYFYDFESKKLLDTKVNIGRKLTKDGRYWLGAPTKRIKKEGFGKLRIYAFDDIKTEVGAYADVRWNYTESIYGIDEVYDSSVYGLKVGWINNPKIRIYELPGKRVTGNFSLYNAESVLNLKENSKDSD